MAATRYPLAWPDGWHRTPPGQRKRATTEDGHPLHSHAVDLFHLLWEALHGPGSWAANPLVWVIGFKRITE